MGDIQARGSDLKAVAEGRHDDGFMEKFAAAFAQTEEFRRIVKAFAPQAMGAWAGKSMIKKAIARPVAKSIAKGFSANGKAGDAAPVADLLADPGFLSSASDELPVLVNGVLAAAASAIEGAASLPAEERARVMKALVGGVDFSNAGRIITGLAKALNGLHQENPQFMADTLRPGIAAFIEGTDFGEVKEAVEGSVGEVTALVKAVNEELWNYPAKFICLISVVPSLANAAVAALKETAAPINRMAPDLLTDVVLSLMNEIDGKNIGMLVNEFCEIVRKIHTGSALLGEPGKPQFPKSVAKLTAETMSTVDINLLLKARGLLSEIKEMTLLTFIGMLEQSPELAKDFFQSHFRALVAFFRRWSHKADAFETLFSDDDVAEEFARGMGEIDAQELAVTISRMCGIFNRVREKTPGIIRNTVAQTISSLDRYEASETARWFTADMVEALKPLAPEILPPVIRGIADLLKQDDGSGEMGEALDYLRSALLGKEAAK
ncbi:MAG TPA: hypothetical protein PKY31_06825 [Spirochaetota bacterium]|nr:hypothetical protein [Spirochaetota bacterium]